MSEIRALLFDTFGTLVDWRTGLITQLEHWGAAHNITADWPAVVLAWRRDHVPALAKVRTGQREWANYDELQSETMRQLAPRFGLPALSDDTLDHLALVIGLARSANITFDAVFGPDVFRQYKLDPKTYLGAVALLGCTPAEVLFVASHPSDLESAAACGLRTCFVSRPLEYGAGVVVEQSPAEGDFDLMVGDLMELATVMESSVLQHI